MRDSPPKFRDWLLVTQYYYPEPGAPQIRLRALVKELTRLGRRVTVLTGMPNYPDGVIHEGYRGTIRLTEELEGVQVHRIWLYPAGGKNRVKRLLNYLSFTFHTLLYLKLARKKDIVFIEAQPITLALYGLFARWLFKVPYVYNTPDLQVEIASERGWVGRSFVRLAVWLEAYLMKQAYNVSTVTHAFIEHFISARGVPKERMSFLPNGVDLEQLRPLPYDEGYAKRMGVVGKKVLTYAGTHADYQGLDVILDAAKQLKHRSDIAFLMVGKGPERQRLIDRAKSEGISNVLFKDSPFEESALLMSISYGFLVVLRDIPAAKKMRLSKTFPPLACGVPVIYAGIGESADIIRKNGCGIVALPENPASLGDAVLKLVDAPAEREAFARAGLKLVEREFSWKTIVSNWLQQLEQCHRMVKGVAPVDDRGRRFKFVLQNDVKSPSQKRVVDFAKYLIGDHTMKYLTRISRISRSLLTLNRDREYRILKRMLELQPTDHLLDVGSGDGFWTARFAKHCARITGLEPDEYMLGLARTLYQRSNVEYVKGSAESIPYPNSTFDKVVSVSCLEHFADPLQGLREMARVLKHGGRLAISVDSLLPENSPAPFREWHARRHFVTHYFSREQLLGMMKQVGLRLEPDRTEHLFRSRLAARVRQFFIRHPRLLLPLFPFLYGVVRLSDRVADDMHGQIIIVTATRE